METEDLEQDFFKNEGKFFSEKDLKKYRAFQNYHWDKAFFEFLDRKKMCDVFQYCECFLKKEE